MDQVGYYPENFFYGMEEYDLSYRILNAGYTIQYNAGITMLHKESTEGRQATKEKIRGMWLNKSIVAYTYLPKWNFYTTAFMWSLFYLSKTRFDLIGWIKNWGAILSIPKKITRNPLSNSTMEYLNKVEARLWY